MRVKRFIPIALVAIVLSVIGLKAYYDFTGTKASCAGGPSVDELKKLLSSETPALQVKAEFCDKKWQIIWVKGGENEQVASVNRVLLHFESNRWTVVDEGDLSVSSYCAYRAQLPTKVRTAMKCAW